MWQKLTLMTKCDLKRVSPIVMGLLGSLMCSTARADNLRSTYPLPAFSDSLLSLSSVSVASYSQDNNVPFVGAENLKLHNFSIRAISGPDSSWHDQVLKLTLSNITHPPLASLCNRSTQGALLCTATKIETAGKHPMFAAAQVYRVGGFEIALLAPHQICKQTDTCTVVVPTFALHAFSRGRTPVLPKLLSVAVLGNSIQVLDGERGHVIFRIGDLPDGLTTRNLGAIVSMEAEYRGELRIIFQNAQIVTHVLNETVKLIASNGRIWSGLIGLHKSRWSPYTKKQGSADCSGNPLHASSAHVVYSKCVVNLLSSNQTEVLPLADKIEGAVAYDGAVDDFKVWAIAGKTLKIQRLKLTSEGLKLFPVSELPFHGRAASEILLSTNNSSVLRKTAHGFYVVDNQGESKTSLPYSDKPSYFSADAQHVLLGIEDAHKRCVLRHLKTSPSAPQFWKESGHLFPCEGAQINAKENGLTITRIHGQQVEIIELN